MVFRFVSRESTSGTQRYYTTVFRIVRRSVGRRKIYTNNALVGVLENSKVSRNLYCKFRFSKESNKILYFVTRVAGSVA